MAARQISELGTGASMAPPPQLWAGEALICFSHLRWDFVFQRPQHLMHRFAQTRRVMFWEEPMPAGEGQGPSLEEKVCDKSGVIGGIL